MSVKNLLPPGEYVTVRDVFILDPHELKIKDEEGQEHTVVVDEKILAKAAKKNNERAEKTGDLSPIVIGHTRDGEGEAHAPEVVGYGSDYKLKRFFKTGKKALACTFHILKEKYAKAKKFQRRSVELWLNSLVIDPISLLGATTPERDLGLMRLAKSGGGKLVAEIDDNGELAVDDNKKEIVEAVMSAIQSSDVWQYMQRKMEEEQGAGGEGETPSGAGDDPLLGAGGGEGEFDPSQAGGLEGALGGEDGDPLGAPQDGPPIAGGDSEEPEEEEQPVRMSAAASGTNTFTPGGLGKQKYARNGDEKIRYARVVQELDATKAVMNDLVVKYRRSEREKALIKLESDGFMFDMNEELDLAQNMSDDQFGTHLNRIKIRYQRVPVGMNPVFQSAAKVNPNAGRTKDEAMNAAKYAVAQGISYGEALEKLRGGQVY